MNVCPASFCLVCMFAMSGKTRTAIAATLPSNSSKHSPYKSPLGCRLQPSEKSAANRLSSTAIASSMGRETRSPRATRLTYDGSTCSLCAILLNRPRQTAWARTPFIAVCFGFILTLCSALAGIDTVHNCSFRLKTSRFQETVTLHKMCAILHIFRIKRE